MNYRGFSATLAENAPAGSAAGAADLRCAAPASSSVLDAHVQLAASGDGPTLSFAALRRSLVRGVSWTGAGRVASALGNVARYFIFARLLTPLDFGVAGAALFALRALSTISGLGFTWALFQQEESPEPFFDTVWVVELARGGVLFVLFIGLARPMATFFKQEQFFVAFWMMAPLALLRVCQSPATIRMYRDMEFHILFLMNGVEIVVGLAVGIVAIAHWRDWRGLVVGTMAAQAARTALSFWYYPYRPRLRFSLMRARQMFRFGRWITGGNIAQFAAYELDNFFVAHLLGPQPLGYYQLAFRAGETPASELVSALHEVEYPLIARLKSQRRSVEQLFWATQIVMLAVGLAYVVVIYVWGVPLIEMTLGHKWLAALAPLKVLCVYGLLQGMIEVGKTFLYGLNAPASSFHLVLIRSVALVVLIYPLTQWYGATGAAWAGLVSVGLSLPAMWIFYRNALSALARRASVG